jgi:rhamnose utilization protein RhaD (predicted bifunctional aldolase and dehydrogenase)
MKNRWSDIEARRWIQRGRSAGLSEDVSLRIYTTRILGEDPQLVLHGGGNTSVKTFPNNIFATMFGFKEKGFFAAEPGSEKAPSVDFSK